MQKVTLPVAVILETHTERGVFGVHRPVYFPSIGVYNSRRLAGVVNLTSPSRAKGSLVITPRNH